MPVPHEPVTVNGGCNCGAVRYRINAPSFEERPPHFIYTPEEAADPKTPRMPLVSICHCYDCRAASGSVLPTWFFAPKNMFTLSCLPKNEDDDDKTIQSRRLAPHDTTGDSKRPPFVPGHGLVTGVEPTTGTWLKVFCSTNEKAPGWDVDKCIYRSFCGRCGTNISYAIYPMPFKLLDTIVVSVGTMDKEDMEKPWMQPERQLWHSDGAPWITEMVKDLDGPIHPNMSMKEVLRE